MKMEKNIENRLRTILENLIDLKDLGRHDLFSQNRIILDSIDLITIVIEIEEEFCIELSDDDILSDFDSIDDLVKIIDKYIY